MYKLKLISITILLLFASPPRAEPVFQHMADCFAPIGNYAQWMDGLKQKNRWRIKSLLLPFMFPREKFEAAQKNLDCQRIIYKNDTLDIYGYAVTPKNIGKHKLPVIIYNRGGNGSFGAITFANLFNHIFPLAQQGYIVLASQYRGFTRTEPEKYGNDEYGGADVRDVTRLIELAVQLPNADPDNIFMLGVSRGGMMSYLATSQLATSQYPAIRALAVVSTATDLQMDLGIRPEMERVYQALIPRYTQNKTRELSARSALHFADKLPHAMPILILHGAADERVNIQNATRMDKRLSELQHPHKLVIYPGDNHFLQHNRQPMFQELLAWFKKYQHKPKAVTPTALSRANADPVGSLPYRKTN